MDEFDGGMGLPDDELMGDEPGAVDGADAEPEGEPEAASEPKSSRRSSGGGRKAASPPAKKAKPAKEESRRPRRSRAQEAVEASQGPRQARTQSGAEERTGPQGQRQEERQDSRRKEEEEGGRQEVDGGGSTLHAGGGREVERGGSHRPGSLSRLPSSFCLPRPLLASGRSRPTMVAGAALARWPRCRDTAAPVCSKNVRRSRRCLHRTAVRVLHRVFCRCLNQDGNMRRGPEHFGEQELSLLYVAQKLKHALRAGTTADRRGARLPGRVG